MAVVPPNDPAQPLSSPGDVVLTASAAFPTFSMTRPLALIMYDVMLDNQPSSSPPDSDTPPTSSVHVTSSSTSLAATGVNGVRHVPSSGPIIAGVLAGMIVIATIVIIIFVKRRHKRPRGRHYPIEAQSLQSGSHSHRLSRIRDGISSNKDSTKQKYHRHSDHSSTAVAPDVVPQDVVPEGERRSRSNTHKRPLSSGGRKMHSTDDSTSSTFSSALNADSIGVDKPNNTAVDGRQASISLSTLPSSETVSSNQVEQYPSGPTSRTELPPQPPSSSSHNENPFQHPTIRNGCALLPEARLNILIQQRAILLASANTSDKSVCNELMLLEEKIQTLKRQNVSPPHQDEPPPYEGHR